MNEIDSGVDLRALRALVAIADGGSFRAAATRLGYSQSAISHRIAALERSLGAPLFARPGGRGGGSPTPAGQAAYAHAPAFGGGGPAEWLIDRRIVLLAPRHREPTAAALTLVEAIKAHLRG